SAAIFTSPGTAGVRATFISSKLNRYRSFGIEMCLGVLGCLTIASFTLRVFIKLPFLLSWSIACTGKSLRFNKTRARSSLMAGLAAARAFDGPTVDGLVERHFQCSVGILLGLQR